VPCPLRRVVFCRAPSYRDDNVTYGRATKKKLTLNPAAIRRAGVNSGPMNANKFTLIPVGLIIALMAGNSAFAQEPIPMEPSGQPGDKRPPLIEAKPPGPPPKLILPLPSPPPPQKPGALPFGRVFIRKIIVTGSTVFSDEELAKITAPYENRELSSEDLEVLRKDLTLFYITKGYITSGAVIPDQTVVDGVISLHIIEGELKNIEIEDNQYFRDSYYKKRT